MKTTRHTRIVLVTAPDLKARSRPPLSDCVAACAVRTLARTETFMPMKPVAPDRMAPMAKPMAVTLPFVLLLLDYWPLGRVAGGG